MLGDGLGDELGEFDGDTPEPEPDGLGLPEPGDVVGLPAEPELCDGLGLADGLELGGVVAVSDGLAEGPVPEAVSKVADTAAADPAAHGELSGTAGAATAGPAAYADKRNEPLTSATTAHPVRAIRIGTSTPLLKSVQPVRPADLHITNTWRGVLSTA